jgi:hypothetical protein
MSSRTESGYEFSGSGNGNGNGKPKPPEGPTCPKPPRERPAAPRKEEHEKKHITNPGHQRRGS